MKQMAAPTRRSHILAALWSLLVRQGGLIPPAPRAADRRRQRKRSAPEGREEELDVASISCDCGGPCCRPRGPDHSACRLYEGVGQRTQRPQHQISHRHHSPARRLGERAQMRSALVQGELPRHQRLDVGGLYRGWRAGLPSAPAVLPSAATSAANLLPAVLCAALSVSVSIPVSVSVSIPVSVSGSVLAAQQFRFLFRLRSLTGSACRIAKRPRAGLLRIGNT